MGNSGTQKYKRIIFKQLWTGNLAAINDGWLGGCA
jgi:hypothetical protein